MIRLGIDVGGTNTDAVLVDGAKVLHVVKTVTTAEVGDGIVTVLRRLVKESAIDLAVVTRWS
jgi:N-methylhydantoinase A/oxoprolinase/acetone carboxylase beta subunit